MGVIHHALKSCKLSVPQPRPACNDSGDALQQRLYGRIHLNPRSGVNHVRSHLRPVSGGELRTADEQARALPSLFLPCFWLKPSAVNQIIDQFPDRVVIIFPIFRCLWSACFGQYLILSCALGTIQYALVNGKLIQTMVQRQRRCLAAAPVGRKYLTLGLV